MGPGLQLTPTPPPASLSSPTLLSSTTKTASPLVSTNSSKSTVKTMEPPTMTCHTSCSPTTHQTPRTISQWPTMAQKAMSFRSISMLDAMLTLFHHQWELSPPVRTQVAHSQSKSPMMHHNFSTSKPPPPKLSISSLLQLPNFFNPVNDGEEF